MEKTFAREDFVRWGAEGAKITNSKLTTEQRKKAAKKAWKTRRNRASSQDK